MIPLAVEIGTHWLALGLGFLCGLWLGMEARR